MFQFINKSCNNSNCETYYYYSYYRCAGVDIAVVVVVSVGVEVAAFRFAMDIAGVVAGAAVYVVVSIALSHNAPCGPKHRDTPCSSFGFLANDNVSA